MYKKTLLPLLIAVASLIGCRQESIRVYDVPHEHVHAAAPPQVALPQGWEEAPRGEMRFASYAIKGTNGAKADVSVVRLPSMEGKDLANVNRWRSAVGQKPLTEDEFAKAAKPVTIGGMPGKLYESSGPSAETDEPTTIVGAVAVRDGMGWYFKMTGPEKFVAAQKPSFLEFLEKYPFPDEQVAAPETAAAASAPAGDPHAGLGVGPAANGADPHAGLNITAAPPTPESGPPPRSWPAPPSWQQQTPGMMQQAKFSVGGGKATVTVSEAGGGLGMNIQRWRTQQLGLPAISDPEAEKLATTIDLNGTPAKLVDLAGKGASMVVIIVPNGQFSVFYKLMGDPATVAAEKQALIEFAKKAK